MQSLRYRWQERELSFIGTFARFSLGRRAGRRTRQRAPDLTASVREATCPEKAGRALSKRLGLEGVRERGPGVVRQTRSSLSSLQG